MKITGKILCVILLSLGASGCLTVETKEYRFNLNADGDSGQGTITFKNILSQGSDSADTAKDFSEMIDDYLHGKNFDTSYPNISGIKKRLFECDGKLCGEISFTFSHLSDINLYRYDSKSPVMYFFDLISETYSASNGTYGGKVMPVMFWKDTARYLSLTTTVAKDTTNIISLLPTYKEWLRKQ
jgi:hypothetical protein